MIKLLKIIVMTLIAICIVVFVGGYVFVKNFDLNAYKKYAQDVVYEQTGRHLIINGDASLAISMVPTVELFDVDFENAPWASTPYLLKVKQMAVKIAIMPLLNKKLVIDEIDVIEPEIYLEESAGRKNWEFAQVKNKAGKKTQNRVASNNLGTSMLATLVAKKVIIKNGQIFYNDDVINLNKVYLSTEPELTMEFDGALNGNNVSGQAGLGELKNFFAENSNVPLNLKIKAFGIESQVKGYVENLSSEMFFNVNMEMFNPNANLDLPEISLSLQAQGTSEKVLAENINMNVGGNIIKGSISADFMQNKPYLDINLNSQLVNIKNFENKKKISFSFPQFIASAQALEFVNDDKVEYAMLDLVNAKIKLAVDKIIFSPAFDVSKVEVMAQLQNSVLNVTPLLFNLGSGQFKLEANVDGKKQLVNAKIASKDMLLQNLHKEFLAEGKGDFGVSKGGEVEIISSLQSKGSTYKALIKNLQGSFIAIMGPATFQSGTLGILQGQFIRDLFNAINVVQTKNKDVNMICGVIRASFANGVATFPQGVAFNSDNMSLTATGTINLIDDRIDFSINPNAKKIADKGISKALTSLIKLEGTLQKPKMVINSEQIMKTMVDVLTTGGVYTGSKLLLGASDSPCYVALKGTGFEKRFPKPSAGERAYQKTTQGINKTVEGSVDVLKNTAKGILNSLVGKKQ